jgi:Ca2+-binding RTX toxin-like protein
MRILGGLGVLALVLLVAGTAPAARSIDCAEYLRIDEAPQWSPDGSEILFLRRRISNCPSEGGISLEVVGADGTGQRTLGVDLAGLTAWSQDGTRIAVSNSTRSGRVLRVLDARNGREQFGLEVPQFSTGGLAWSPDGEHVALGSLIVDLPSGRVHGPGVPTFGSPAWSPDSRRIAYLSAVGLEVASATTGTRQWIGPGGSGNDGSVYWSPNGSRIVYEMSRDLMFVAPDGSNFLEMPDEGFLLGWEPDSEAVLTYVPEDRRLLAIDKDDGSARQIGSADLRPESFSWTRMSSAFGDTDLCPRPGIFLQTLAGAAPRRLTNDCVIRGTAGPDRLVGTSLPDAMVGLGGNDKLYGLGGDDILFGGAGRDEISGGLGDDRANGGTGNDTVSAETATGGSGRDTLIVGSNPEWPAKDVHVRDGERDVVRCPLGQWPGPFIFADRIDRISSRCYGT